MKDYTLLRTWKPATELEFIYTYHEFNDNPDMSECWFFNSLEELTDELEYQGINFNALVELTKNRYGHVVEIIEYDKTFYMFIGAR